MSSCEWLSTVTCLLAKLRYEDNCTRGFRFVIVFNVQDVRHQNKIEQKC